MGGEVFSSRTAGSNAQAAFDAAVEQAQYDYGHAGYTGTIAEKHSFTMIRDQPLDIGAVEALAEQLLRDQDERIDDKWGPAGCLPVDDGTFYFFGWASS